METPLWQWAILGLLSVTGSLLVADALPPNRWLGVRTVRTLSTNADWYRMHRVVGVITLGLTLGTVLLKIWPPHPLVYAIAGVFGMVGSAGAYAIAYRRYAV